VRAVAASDLYTARLARAHNDANVLALGARIVALPLAEAILDVFLETPFDGGRHLRRVEKLDGSPA
jgi:ribose 5-phosphate isomerase B